MRPSGLVCHVRFAAASDEAAWRRLWQGYCDFYNVTLPPGIADSLWDRIMDAGTPVNALIAETGQRQDRDREVVGFANYVLHPYTWGTELVCYLEDLFVVSHARRNGVGGALITRLIDLCRENGWPRLYWHTHEANGAARALYESFTPVDPFVRYLIKTV